MLYRQAPPEPPKLLLRAVVAGTAAFLGMRVIACGGAVEPTGTNSPPSSGSSGYSGSGFVGVGSGAGTGYSGSGPGGYPGPGSGSTGFSGSGTGTTAGYSGSGTGTTAGYSGSGTGTTAGYSGSGSGTVAVYSGSDAGGCYPPSFCTGSSGDAVTVPPDASFGAPPDADYQDDGIEDAPHPGPDACACSPVFSDGGPVDHDAGATDASAALGSCSCGVPGG
jgi:hypothetical protein